jgi:Ca2+-binding EF-hand superfamily protein
LKKYSDGGNEITSKNLQEFIARLSNNVGMSISNNERKSLSTFLLDNQSACSCNAVVSKLLNDSLVAGCEAVRLKLCRAFEVQSLKGKSISDLLGSFGTSDNLSLAELTSTFKSFEQNAFIESIDSRIVIRFFAKSKSFLSTKTVYVADIISFLGLKDFKSVKENLEVTILQNLASCRSLFDQWGVHVLTEVKIVDFFRWIETLFPTLCSNNKQTVMSLISTSSKNGLVSWVAFAQSISFNKKLATLGDPLFFLRSLVSKAESKGIDVYDIIRSTDKNSGGSAVLTSEQAQPTSSDELMELFSSFDISCDLSLIETAVELFLESMERLRESPVTLSETLRNIGIDECQLTLLQKISKVFAVACDRGLSLESIFSELDKDKSGQISVEEFLLGLKDIGTFPDVSTNDVRVIIGEDILTLKRFIECFQECINELIKRKSYILLTKKLAKCRIFLRRDSAASKDLKDILAAPDESIIYAKLRTFLFKFSFSEDEANDAIDVVNKEAWGNSFNERFSLAFLGRVERPPQQDASHYANSTSGVQTPKYLLSSTLDYDHLLSRDTDEEYVYSSDIEIRNAEKKMRRIIRGLLSKGVDISEALHSFDVSGSGCISRDDFVSFLSQNGIVLLSQSGINNNRASRSMKGVGRIETLVTLEDVSLNCLYCMSEYLSKFASVYLAQ